MDYHQSVAERQPNLVLKLAYLKDMDNLDPLDISWVYGGKENVQGKIGVYVTSVITYKNKFMVNLQPVKLSLVQG